MAGGYGNTVDREIGHDCSDEFIITKERRRIAACCEHRWVPTICQGKDFNNSPYATTDTVVHTSLHRRRSGTSECFLVWNLELNCVEEVSAICERLKLHCCAGKNCATMEHTFTVDKVNRHSRASINNHTRLFGLVPRCCGAEKTIDTYDRFWVEVSTNRYGEVSLEDAQTYWQWKLPALPVPPVIQC